MLENTVPYNDHANMVHIDWHHSGYFDNPAASARATYLGASAAPDTYFDGVDNVVGAGDSVSAFNQYKARVDAHYASLSSLIISGVLLDFDCATETGTIEFDVEVAPGESIPNIANVKVRAALYESDIYVPGLAPEPRTGNTIWNNIGRAMPVEIPLTIDTAGQVQTVSQTFPLDPSWNTHNFGAIAFVERDTDKRVLQAGHGEAKYGFEVVNNDPLEVKTNGAMVEWNADMTYLGVIDDDVLITIDGSGLPPGWATQVIHGIDADPTSITIPNMTMGQQESYLIRVTPSDNTPVGSSFTVTVAPASSPTSCLGVSTTYTIFNNTEAILIVNDDNGDGFGAGAAMKAAVAAAGHSAILREAAVEGSPGAADLAFYDAVIWSTGRLSAFTIFPNEQAALASYLDSGGKFALFSQGYLNHQGITAFTSGYLGVSGFMQDQQALNCTGVPGDIADGISFSTSGPFPDFSDTQVVGAGAAAWLTGHLGNTVGTRYATRGFQTTFTSVAFELMTPPAGDQVMNAILDWFFPSGGTGVTPGEARLSLALAQNAPNPFRAGTSVGFALPQDGLVKLSVFNVAGQKVVDLANRSFPAGRHTVSWDGRDAQGRPVASGVYLYRLEAEDGTLTREMVRLK